MSVKYAAQEAMASRILSAKGRQVTISRGDVSDVSIDPVTQTGGVDGSTYTVQMLALPLSVGKAAFLFGAGGGDVMKPRLDCYIAAMGRTPAKGDTFIWSGRLYTFLEPELLDPAGDGAIYAHAIAEA